MSVTNTPVQVFGHERRLDVRFGGRRGTGRGVSQPFFAGDMIFATMVAMVVAWGGTSRLRAPRPAKQLPSYDELYPKARSTVAVTLRPVADPTAALQVDLEAAPSNLLRMAEARADQFRDIVLLTSDVRQLSIAANLVSNLASVGVHHYILIADQASTCAKVAGRLACVWSTLLEPTYTAKLRSGGTDRVRALWLMRQMYVGRLARLGYNPMMLDADVVLFRNPFALIRTYLPGYQVYVLGDTSAGWMSANAGTLYPCPDTGPVTLTLAATPTPTPTLALTLAPAPALSLALALASTRHALPARLRVHCGQPGTHGVG